MNYHANALIGPSKDFTNLFQAQCHCRWNGGGYVTYSKHGGTCIGVKAPKATAESIAWLLNCARIAFDENDLRLAVRYLNGPRICRLYDALPEHLMRIVTIPRVNALRPRTG